MKTRPLGRSIWRISAGLCLCALLAPLAVRAQPRDLAPAPLPGAASTGVYHAVIIGIGNYLDPGIPALHFTQADARSVYDLLTDPRMGLVRRENVDLLLGGDATRERILKALLVDLPRRAGPEDTVIIYYSGHGAPEPDPSGLSPDGLEKYLVPNDAKKDALPATAISMADVEKALYRIRARRLVLIIDSCYSGASAGGLGRSFARPGIRALPSDDFVRKLAEAGEGRVVLTASEAREVSLELPELGHGIFSHYLIEGLRGAADANGDRLVSVDEAYGYLFKRVEARARQAGARQTPVKLSRVQGDIYLSRTAPGVALPASPPLTPGPPPASATAPPSTAGMVLIAAGPFIYGEEGKEQKLALPAFYMDLHEVTNAEYAKVRPHEYPPDKANHPVVNVSWHDANRYCEAVGKRLPSEQEWEKAARGTDGRHYPWGDTYDPKKVNSERRFGGTTPVGQFPAGRSPYGLFDMAGNVLEWTASERDRRKVIRGGCWLDYPNRVRSAYSIPYTPHDPALHVGFRCARGSQ